MKKILFMLVCILQILVVFCVKSAYNERDLSDIPGSFGLEKEKKSTFFEVMPNIKGYDNEQFLNDLVQISKEYNCAVERSEYNNSEYIWYLYSPYDIFKIMDINKISDNDITYDNQKRYDTEQNSLHLFNQDIRFIIRPFKDLNQRFQNLAGDYRLWYDQEEEKNAFLAGISKQYPSAIQELGAFERHEFTLSAYLMENIIPMCIISFLLLGLLLIMLVNQKLKAIGILKSMGISGLRIGRILYQKLFFQIFAVSFISMILAYIWMIGTVSRQAYEAILLLSFFWIGFLFGILLVFAITVLLILRSPVYAFIKNKNFTRRFMNLNYIYGVLALLILMPMCTAAWQRMQQNLPTLQVLFKQRKMLDSYVYAFDYQDGFRFDGYDEASIEEDYKNKKTIQNEMYYVHLNEYEMINKAGGIFYQKGVIPIGEKLQPYAEVNLNYIKRFALRMQDGSRVKLKNKKDTVYILLPVSMKNTDVSAIETYGNQIEKLYIQDDQSNAGDFSLLDNMLETTSRLFYVVYSDDAFRLGKKVTNFVYLDVDQQDILTSVHNGINLELVNSNERIQERLQLLTKELFLQGAVFIPSGMLILLIMAEYTYLYLLSFRQRIFVRRVQRTSFFRVYLRLFTELSAPFVFVIALLHEQEDWKITCVFLIVSLIASMLFVYIKDKGIRKQSREVNI